jgi:SAM-dependent methyltransferase
MIHKGFVKLGVALYGIDQAINTILRRRKPFNPKERLDKTGRITPNAQRIQTIACESGVRLIRYPGNHSHSIWRSQELSLFESHKRYLAKPCLDFGCGDGSFASMLLDRIEYGFDVDFDALQVAKQYNIYGQLACCDGALLPAKAHMLGSVFSNSVLEHVENLEETIGAISSALAPGGFFVFTVPVLRFAEHLRQYFGRTESDRINQSWYHRHLHPSEWWRDLLRKYGFEILEIRNYQPDWFTLTYFTLATRPFRLLFRCGLAGKEGYRRRVARMIADSIANTTDGGNIFVIAQRLRQK